MLPVIQGEMRVVADPELRFAPSGMAIGTVRLVSNSRKKEGDEWVDDKVCWLRGVLFKKQAENMVESVSKGDLVVVTGRLHTDEYEKDGVKRTSVELLIDEIGVSLRWATAKAQRAERTQGSSSSSSSGSGQRGAPADDPWAGNPNASDEPPF